ncbi:uncharacterized protein [Periplaneta americana]|uniref:uncharacterized protein n=1 Tax=Periplaneta americana TaxID=6978 RepID=UPI0037E8E338
MLAKSVFVGFLGCVFIQVINIAESADGSQSDTLSANTTEELCSLPAYIEPFIPWAQQLIKSINDSVTDVTLLKSQVNEGCTKMKDGTSTDECKLWMADRLETYGEGNRRLVSDMQSIIQGAGPVIDAYFKTAADLRELVKQSSKTGSQ